MGFFDVFKSNPSKSEIDAQILAGKLAESEKINKALKQALKEEAVREASNNKKSRQQALAHLKVAERYQESIATLTGSRKTEIQAIVDKRVENAANLGLRLRGTISETIDRYA